MALPELLHSDHEVLGDDYCPGYVDAFGNWNNGFPCPALPPVHCCGTATHKYCCVLSTDASTATTRGARLPLVLGVVVGAAVAVLVVTVVSCLHCSCCLLYKKRQPSTTGPSYRLQGGTRPCPGVANMYSYSRATTPRHSLSRSSSMRSGTSSDSNCHSLSSVRGAATRYLSSAPQSLRTPTSGPQSPFLPQFAHFSTGAPRSSVLHGARSDCGSLISSRSSSATHSDNACRDPPLANGRLPSYISSLPVSPVDDVSTLSDLPPPYSSNPPPSSTLVAVRTSGVANTGPLRQQLASATVNNRLSGGARRAGDVFIVGTGEHGCTSGMLTTFTQAPSSSCSSPPAPSSARLSSTDLHYNPSLSGSTLGNLNCIAYSSNDEENDRLQFVTSHRNDAPATGLCDKNSPSLGQSNDALCDGNVISSAPGLEADDLTMYQFEDSDSGRASNSAGSMSPYNDNGSSSIASQCCNPTPHQSNATSPQHSNAVLSSISDSVPSESPYNSSQLINSIKKRPPMGVTIGSFSPALKPVTRPCSTAHIINTLHNSDDLSSATSDLPPKMFNMNMTKF